MDFSPIFQQLITALWYLIPLLIVGGAFKTSWFKGRMGEAIINVSAHLILDKNIYYLIRNVTRPTEMGTTQVDQIIVSPFDVFVVETKNMKGGILGSAKQRLWTQKIYRYSQRFQKPLHQHYKRVKILQKLLGPTDAQIH